MRKMPTISSDPPHSKNAASESGDAATAALPEGLLTVHEVARILHISRSMVYVLIRSGDLPSIRIQRLHRLAPHDVQRYMQRNQERQAAIGRE